MTALETDSRGKAKRALVDRARRLAAEGSWSEAVEVNQQIIERTPRDADAYNRLGKALFELRRYRSAYEAYQKSIEIDPANVIAQRNVSRIEPLKDTEEDRASGVRPRSIRPGIFIEEVGKTYVDDLVNVAESTVLTELSSGDQLTLQVQGEEVLAFDQASQYIGQFEPRLARRIIELIGLGNEYEVYVTSSTGGSARVIVRETFRHPEMGSRLSFPRQGKVAIPRAYLRDTRLFRDEPDMLLGDDEDDDADVDDTDEFDAADSDEEESDYVEESGTTIDEEEEEPI